MTPFRRRLSALFSLFSLFSRACEPFRRQHRDGELADELDSHLQSHIDDNLRAGMTRDEARRVALLALGGLDQTKAQYRERRGRIRAPVVARRWPGLALCPMDYRTAQT